MTSVGWLFEQTNFYARTLSFQGIAKKRLIFKFDYEERTLQREDSNAISLDSISQQMAWQAYLINLTNKYKRKLLQR